MTRFTRMGPPLLAMSVSVFCSVIGAEVVARRVDGYSVGSMTLRRSDKWANFVADSKPDLKYVDQIPRASAVSPEWYAERPQPISRIPLTAESQKRAEACPR